MKRVCEHSEWYYITLESEEKSRCVQKQPKREVSCGFTAAFEKISNGLAFDVDLNQKNIVEKVNEERSFIKSDKKEIVEKVFPLVLWKNQKQRKWKNIEVESL
jgi:hypothetical protein